jgi:hypothetical protein
MFRNCFLPQRSQRFSAEFTEIGIILNNSKSAKLCELCVFTEFTMFKKLSVLCGNFSSLFRSFEIGISLQCKKKVFSKNEKTFVGVAGFEPAAFPISNRDAINGMILTFTDQEQTLGRECQNKIRNLHFKNKR